MRRLLIGAAAPGDGGIDGSLLWSNRLEHGLEHGWWFGTWLF